MVLEVLIVFAAALVAEWFVEAPHTVASLELLELHQAWWARALLGVPGSKCLAVAVDPGSVEHQ